MKFNVLGPVELAGSARPLPPKIRVLLAVLLVRANSVVSTERLIGEIWDSAEPPRTVVATLQAYVSRLRVLLPPAPDGTTRLLGRSPGYRLHLLPDECDLSLFERLSQSARQAFKLGDIGTAERLLGQALALWRGPAFADVTAGHIITGAVVVLNEARLAAVELRTECRLMMGQHLELLPELQLLAAEHPYQERLAGQLMIALARSGRQADAILTFERVRLRLAEDLALIPSEQLSDIHQRVLLADPALLRPRSLS
jgi:DNA-binding SARP family transcriptional activator